MTVEALSVRISQNISDLEGSPPLIWHTALLLRAGSLRPSQDHLSCFLLYSRIQVMIFTTPIKYSRCVFKEQVLFIFLTLFIFNSLYNSLKHITKQCTPEKQPRQLVCLAVVHLAARSVSHYSAHTPKHTHIQTLRPSG